MPDLRIHLFMNTPGSIQGSSSSPNMMRVGTFRARRSGFRSKRGARLAWNPRNVRADPVLEWDRNWLANRFQPIGSFARSWTRVGLFA